MWSQIRPAVTVLFLLTVITGGLYPAVVTVIAQSLFHDKASGSLVIRDGKPIGSKLIGQTFGQPGHFWSRPSATTPVPYAGDASAGSNMGPSNPALIEAVKQRIAALKAADPGNSLPIPVDLVTASGSGLDPHISVAAADYQISRVARARGISLDKVKRLVEQNTEGRTLRVLGQPRVNVLMLNIALDRQ